jgi:hypothetical protein
MVIDAARTSETSVDIQLRTRQYIPEDSQPHKSWVITPIPGSDKQVTGRQGDLCHYGLLSKVEDRGHKTGLFRGPHPGRGKPNISLKIQVVNAV